MITLFPFTKKMLAFFRVWLSIKSLAINSLLKRNCRFKDNGREIKNQKISLSVLASCSLSSSRNLGSARKQPTFTGATTGFPAKWWLRNEHRNFILMTHYYTQILVVLLISWSQFPTLHDDHARDLKQNLVCACPHYKCTARIENYGKFPFFWCIICLCWRGVWLDKWNFKVATYSS